MIVVLPYPFGAEKMTTPGPDLVTAFVPPAIGTAIVITEPPCASKVPPSAPIVMPRLASSIVNSEFATAPTAPPFSVS